MALECYNSDVVRIIGRAKALYLKNTRGSNGFCGMCECINRVIYDNTRYSDFDTRFLRCIINANFNREIAVSKFGADTIKAYWWPLENYSARIHYFDWLIEQ